MRRFRDERLYEREGSRFIWARVRNANGYIDRVSTRCTDEKAASLFADEEERKAADPAYARAAAATLAVGLQEWFDELARRNSGAVVQDIARKKLGHFVRIWGVNWPLLRITNDLVLAYIDQRAREPGATRGSTVKPLTIRRELDHLRRMLEWAKFRGLFPTEIATVIPPGFSGKHKPRTRAPSPEELVRLLQNLAPHRAAHVAYIVASGARKGESFRACREDVDLQGLTIHLRGTKTERADDRVPITGLTHVLVIYALQHAPGDAPLFAPWGKLNRDLAAACIRTGIARVSPNDLRRAYGKWHRLAGLTAEQVGMMLRHTTSTLAQTTYAKISAADVGEALRKTVPILYAETAQTAPEDPNAEDGSTVNIASPVEFESTTPGLGNQSTQGASSPRSVGNKLAHARRRATRSVPELRATLESPTYFAWLDREVAS